MNVKLEQLFDFYHLSFRDRYELRQIFLFVSMSQRQKILDNFSQIVAGIRELQADIILEQEILLGKTLETIESRVLSIGKKHIRSLVGNLLFEFKKSI